MPNFNKKFYDVIWFKYSLFSFVYLVFLETGCVKSSLIFEFKKLAFVSNLGFKYVSSLARSFCNNPYFYFLTTNYYLVYTNDFSQFANFYTQISSTFKVFALSVSGVFIIKLMFIKNLLSFFLYYNTNYLVIINYLYYYVGVVVTTFNSMVLRLVRLIDCCRFCQ